MISSELVVSSLEFTQTYGVLMGFHCDSMAFHGIFHGIYDSIPAERKRLQTVGELEAMAQSK